MGTRADVLYCATYILTWSVLLYLLHTISLRSAVINEEDELEVILSELRLWVYSNQCPPNFSPTIVHSILSFFDLIFFQDEDEEDEHYSEDNLSYVYSDYDDSLHGYDSYDDPYDSDMFPF